MAAWPHLLAVHSPFRARRMGEFSGQQRKGWLLPACPSSASQLQIIAAGLARSLPQMGIGYAPHHPYCWDPPGKAKRELQTLRSPAAGSGRTARRAAILPLSPRPPNLRGVSAS